MNSIALISFDPHALARGYLLSEHCRDLLRKAAHALIIFGYFGSLPEIQTTLARPQRSIRISFLVWQIHKPIAGVVGSYIGALQPGKVDNQCVEKIPLFVFRGMERRPPTVGRYPGAYLRSLD